MSEEKGYVVPGVPDGWELVAIRPPKEGEWFMGTGNMFGTHQAQMPFESVFPIVRKIEPPLQLREGGWYERRDGKIVGPVKKTGWKDSIEFSCDGLTYWKDGQWCKRSGKKPVDLIREVEPPKPVIDPGEGWRLLEPDESVAWGDECKKENGSWVMSGQVTQTKGLTYRRRIAPNYRPFANAAEFMPHRDRWLKSKNGTATGKVGSYGDDGCYAADSSFKTYEQMFEHVTFDDGTPCGVKV